MAFVVGNYGVSESRGNNGGGTHLILKPELRKNWHVYLTTNGTIFRPYPVFDPQGNCCPPIVDPDGEGIHMLPDAFAGLKIATFAGTGRDLDFVDLCIDIDKWANGGYLKTPFELLSSAMERMLPQKTNPSVTSDGYPTPRVLREISRYGAAKSADCVLCRAALLANGQRELSDKAAIDGVLYSAVVCIKQGGAKERFFELFKQRLDVRKDLSSANSAMSTVFNIDGCTVNIQASRGRNAQGKEGTQYTAVQGFDPNYARKFASVFRCSADDSGYWGALANSLFGPYQKLEDIFYIMTVQEMVDMLKSHYPISWLWYAWKDTPFAEFVSADEQRKAIADPEMSARFGVPSGSPAYSPSPAPQPQPQPQPETLQQPTWRSPGFGETIPQRPVQNTGFPTSTNNPGDGSSGGENEYDRLAKKYKDFGGQGNK